MDKLHGHCRYQCKHHSRFENKKDSDTCSSGKHSVGIINYSKNWWEKDRVRIQEQYGKSKLKGCGSWIVIKLALYMALQLGNSMDCKY